MASYVEFKNIKKGFPGVQALDDVSFRVEGGRICALMGENGAGKSTMLKILSGDYKADEGGIFINGKSVAFNSPYDALKASISVIYQERQLVSGLSVMENIFIEDLPTKGITIDRTALRKKTQDILNEFELDFSPNEPVGRLSVAHQQMVEIMKAYRRDADIIAFDEPTAPLSENEINVLFKIIRKLRAAGKVIIYVSHRMSEIFKISDDIVVLKDGQLVCALRSEETNEQELIRAMVGRDIGDTYKELKRNENIGDVVLELRNLETDDVHNINLEVRQGEIVGFAGLIGAGRTELARAIFAADPIKSGEILLDGKFVKFKSPKDAIDAGIALCPEDRKEQGLVLDRTISNNISSAVLSKVRTGPFLSKKKERRLANDAVKKYSIKTPTIEKQCVELSGGNQQKVILGRWTSDQIVTKVLILDEPTKGIDIGAKAEIYQTVCDFAKSGLAVIFISSELTEVINIADKIVVMSQGRISGLLTRGEASEEKVLKLAMHQ